MLPRAAHTRYRHYRHSHASTRTRARALQIPQSRLPVRLHCVRVVSPLFSTKKTTFSTHIRYPIPIYRRSFLGQKLKACACATIVAGSVSSSESLPSFLCAPHSHTPNRRPSLLLLLLVFWFRRRPTANLLDDLPNQPQDEDEEEHDVVPFRDEVRLV